jgi:hypothetical protein
MRSLINNLRIFYLILALILAVQLSATAQKPTQRTEPGATSSLRPTQEDIKNAVWQQDESMRRGMSDESLTQQLELLNNNWPDAAPANDMFADAQSIAGSYGSVTGTNVDATVEPGEPNAFAGHKTVWYRWTAPANLSMTFQTQAGTLSDTVLGVYMGGSVNALTTLGWNDDINGSHNECSRVTFIANGGTTYYIQVRGYATTSGTFTLRWEVNGAESWKQFNFDGNAGSVYSDFAVFRPSTGIWWIWSSANQQTIAHQWGLAGDYLVPGDYDGDGATDVAVFRSGVGTFFVLHSMDNTVEVRQWGLLGDRPVQGDFDGDDHADFAIFRPSTGTFWIRNSVSGNTLGLQWGVASDFLACGDYDGDGKTDLGVQRNVGGYAYFYIRRSSDQTWYAVQFGFATDSIVPGDYDFDGKNDIAVYRYSNNYFYYLRSRDGDFRAYQWGLPGDVLTPGDYINSYGSDICVWRPADGNFYCLDPVMPTIVSAFHWGMNGDYPVATSNVH